MEMKMNEYTGWHHATWYIIVHGADALKINELY